LTALVATTLSSGPSRCGQRWSDVINAGQTASVTLQYGAPVALYTLESPTLAGCAPAAGYYSEGQTVAKATFTYASGSTADLPLLSTCISNTSDMASYSVSYEQQVEGSYASLRPHHISIDNGAANASLSYDNRGRVVSVNWTSANESVASLIASQRVRMSSPPLHFRGHRRGSGSFTKGHEKFAYEDPSHPLHATYYESLDQDGLTRVAYRWHSDKEGRITDVVSTQSENASFCPHGCSPPDSCCRDVGSSDPIGSCFAVASCDDLGNTTWHYEYDSKGRIALMNVSGQVQSYSYDLAGRMTKYWQPAAGGKNTTMFQAVYEGGQIKGQVFWVIYPVFPEAWGFDAPKESAGIQYV